MYDFFDIPKVKVPTNLNNLQYCMHILIRWTEITMSKKNREEKSKATKTVRDKKIFITNKK